MSDVNNNMLESSTGTHSPGPWKSDFEEAVGIKDSNGATLAIVTNLHLTGRRHASEVEANARLIAAAPELFKRLELTTDSLEIILMFVGDALSQEKRKLIEQRIEDNYATIVQATGDAA